MTKKTKKKMKNRTKFVIVSIIHIDVFTIANMIAVYLGKDLSEALIVAFFAAFTGELAGMLWIKLSDKKDSEE